MSYYTVYGQHVNNVHGNNKTKEGKELVWQVPWGDLYRVSSLKNILCEEKQNHVICALKVVNDKNFTTVVYLMIATV